jgi:hypothetical protein
MDISRSTVNKIIILIIIIIIIILIIVIIMFGSYANWNSVVGAANRQVVDEASIVLMHNERS